MTERFGRVLLDKRWLFLIAALLFFAVSVVGLGKLRMVTDPRTFFDKKDPMMVALNELEDTYSRMEGVTFVVVPKDGDIFTKDALSAIDWLTRKGWTLPYSSRVDSIANYQHTSAVGDDLMVEPLYDEAEQLSDERLKEIREIALNEPSLAGLSVAKRGHVATVNVLTTRPNSSGPEGAETVAATRAVAEEFKTLYPNIELMLAGTLMFDDAFLEEANRDMTVLIPAMFLLMIVVTYASLRSVAGTVGTVIVIVAAAATGMGLSGWLDIPVGDVASLAPTITLTLAVADSIHILATIMQQMREGKEKRAAIEESLRVNMQPVFLTSITTTLGFLSMNFSSSPVFHDLGNMVALGVMAAWGYSIILLPPLILLLPLKPPKEKKNSRLADMIGDMVVHKRRPLLIFMGVLIILFISGISRIELNDNFMKYISEESPTRQSAEFMEEHLNGADILEYSINAKGENGITDPEYLQNLEKFEKWLLAQPNVTHVTTINSIMKRLNKSMHGDEEAWYKVPANKQLAAQYLLLYEMSLPFGLDLTTQTNLDKSASRVTVYIEDSSTALLTGIELKAEAWMAENLPEYMRAKTAGLSIMFANLSMQNVRSMLFGTGSALLLISGILIIAFRSFKMGLISLIPNLVPALMAFGLWGFVMGQVGLAAAIVAAMTLGIVVDDTVHFLSKYLRARRELNLPPEEAVRYSFHTVGAAIMITSAILVFGFGLLASSGFLINSQMGLLTAITIGFALLADFLFLPPFLIKMEEK